MKVALIIPFFNQYEEFPYVLEGIKQQKRKPEQLILSIDDSKADLPDLGGLPFTVVRTDKEFDGIYSRGAAINAGIKVCTCNVAVTTDADCIMCPDMLKTYRDIFAGNLKRCLYTVARTGNQRTFFPNKRKNEFYVGPRFWVPTPKNLPPVAEYNWDAMTGICAFDRHGYRGRTDGRVEVWGCNMGFRIAATKLALFRDSGRHQDTKWYRYLQHNHDYEARPMPDTCFVLHMGPTYEGSYYNGNEEGCTGDLEGAGSSDTERGGAD